MLRKALAILLLTIVATYTAASAQTTASTTDSLAAVVGKWTGTFDGASSGKFELVLNKDASNKLGGQIIMLADDGNKYPIDLKTANWRNGKLSASYSDPSGGDVSFSGTLTDPTLKGSWEANGGQATGTWQLTRAPK
ncbi:hypothetical protein GCM10027341_02350 [Spirosoma knui]